MNENKVLFLEVNSSYSHSMLSYGMLRAYTEKMAPEWQWDKIEFTVRNIDEEQLRRKLREYRPDVVCGTAYLFNVGALLKCTSIVREELPECRIVLGGPEFLGDNRAFLTAHPEIDAVISGDESTFYLYLRDNQAINGCYEGELDDLPSPHQLGYVSAGKPFWQIETSRGCGGRCIFCTSSLFPRVKYHSLERVRADLTALQRAGFQEIRVLDRTFNRNQGRAVDLLKMFRLEFQEMRFHLEIEPGGFQPEFLTELVLGNLHVEAGVQSLDPVVLQACRRRGEPEIVLKSLRELLRCRNFELHVDLIAGLPEQTSDSLLKDVRTLIGVYPHEIQLETLKILPGTDLRQSSVCFNPEPPYEVRSTGTMSPAELAESVSLGKILDGWFNVPQLRSSFARAVNSDPGFLSAFLKFIAGRPELFATGKPPLELRFKLLADFLPEGPEKEVLRFAAIACGIDGELPRMKIPEITGSTLWNLETPIKPERCIIAEFQGNAGECWLDSAAPWQNESRRYCFKLHYGRLVSEISVL